MVRFYHLGYVQSRKKCAKQQAPTRNNIPSQHSSETILQHQQELDHTTKRITTMNYSNLHQPDRTRKPSSTFWAGIMMKTNIKRKKKKKRKNKRKNNQHAKSLTSQLAVFNLKGYTTQLYKSTKQQLQQKKAQNQHLKKKTPNLKK